MECRGDDREIAENFDMKATTKHGNAKNKRKDKRKPIPTSLGFAALDKNHTAIIKNISDGGMFLDTVAPIGIGKDVAMKIQLTEDQEPIMIIGEVAWNSPRGLGVRFKMGFDASLIQFLMDDL
jgi:Tfp pilus assembly protein PilZ